MAWDLLDEDCSGIDDWTDHDAGNGVSEVSPAGQFRMDGNTAVGGGMANRSRDIGLFPDIFTFEIKLYHDKLGTKANEDHFLLVLGKVDVKLIAAFDTGGLLVYDGSSYNEVGTDLVKHTGAAEWQTWRFIVDMTTPASAVCDIYLIDSTHENEKVGSAIDCSYTGTFDEGKIEIIQYCRVVDDQLAHIDYVKAASGELTLELAGSIGAQSGITGSLLSRQELAGSIGAQSGITGNLQWPQELAGSISSQSSLTGDIRSIEILSGLIEAQSTLVGDIDFVLIFGLAGLISGQSGCDGHINAIEQLSGQIAAQATLTAKLRDLSSLSGTIDAQSSSTGRIISTELLAGLIAAQSSLLGDIESGYGVIPSEMHKDLIDPYGDMGAWIWLVEIVVPTQATQRIARNPVSVVYGIITFVAGNFEPPGQIPLVGDGSIPRIQLRVAQDGTGTLENIINATKGGENGTVKLIRTCEKYFNSPVKALEHTYDILIAGSDPQWVTFSLGIPSPLTQRIPLWSYSSKVCPLATPSLFKGPRCKYSDGDAVCTGLLSDCRTKGNAENWGAEAGLDPNAVRV